MNLCSLNSTNDNTTIGKINKIHDQYLRLAVFILGVVGMIIPINFVYIFQRKQLPKTLLSLFRYKYAHTVLSCPVIHVPDNVVPLPAVLQNLSFEFPLYGGIDVS